MATDKAAAPVSAPAAAAPAKAQEKAPANEKDAKGGPAAAVDKGVRVFIGNLNFNTTADELKKHIEAVVPVVHAEVISYASGRSKGCGLAELKSAADAEKAMKHLTNSELGNRKIFVREDREPKDFGKGAAGATGGAPKAHAPSAGAPHKDSEAPRGERGGRGGRGRGGRGRGRGGRGRGGRYGGDDAAAPQRAANSDPCNLFVGNLPWATTEQELKGLFADYGSVIKCVIAQDRSGRSKGFATVTFSKASDAAAAVEGLHDSDVGERKIVVRVDHYSA